MPHAYVGISRRQLLRVVLHGKNHHTSTHTNKGGRHHRFTDSDIYKYILYIYRMRICIYIYTHTSVMLVDECIFSLSHCACRDMSEWGCGWWIVYRYNTFIYYIYLYTFIYESSSVYIWRISARTSEISFASFIFICSVISTIFFQLFNPLCCGLLIRLDRFSFILTRSGTVKTE